jgi:hypothetical protein
MNERYLVPKWVLDFAKEWLDYKIVNVREDMVRGYDSKEKRDAFCDACHKQGMIDEMLNRPEGEE